MPCFRKYLNICLGSVGRQMLLLFFVFCFFLYRKSKKILQNTLKIEEKFTDIPKCFRVGPKKVGSVGLPETKQFFLAEIQT